MSILYVQQALLAGASAALAGIPIEYENAEIEKPEADKWARVFFMPAQPAVDTLGADGEDRIDGILQIDINYPRNSGDSAARADFEEIRGSFPAGAKFTQSGQSATIKNCGRSQGRLADNWYRMSITVGWYAFVPR